MTRTVVLGLPALVLLIAAIVVVGYVIVRRPKVGALLVGVGVAVLALLFLSVRQRQVAVVESHRSHVVEEQARAAARAIATSRDSIVTSAHVPDDIDGYVQEVAESEDTAVALARAQTEKTLRDTVTSSRPVLASGYMRSDVIRTVLTVAALFAMVTLAYLFLDAGTKGYYTWPLRIGAALAFAVLCVAVIKVLSG